MEDKFVQLTGAVYSLLDFFPEGEPLKNRAKDKVLSITEKLTLVFGTQGWASLQKDKAANQLLEDIEVFLNYLKIARSFGWIDGTNFLIISKEYDKIKSQVNQLSEKIAVEPAKSDENLGIVAKTQKVTFQKTVENQISFTKEERVSPPKAPEFLISERQKKILQILNEKGKAQVSDFKNVLIDVTKRTIRRDLDELLKNGKIVRVGEWNQVFYQIGQV